jgi:predicted RNase H-like HicB family nuclease
MKYLKKYDVNGWSIDYEQLEEISRTIKTYPVGMEEIEEVILALIELGYLTIKETPKEARL